MRPLFLLLLACVLALADVLPADAGCLLGRLQARRGSRTSYRVQSSGIPANGTPGIAPAGISQSFPTFTSQRTFFRLRARGTCGPGGCQ